MYITGIELFNSTGQNAFLWKNGVKTILTTLNPTGTTRVGTGIALAGSDVYVCGNMGATAVYWKNGVEHVLSDPGGGMRAEATGIAVSGGDVYVTGREGTHGVYWKNGVKTDLTPLISGTANGILVSGSDVYIVGRKDNQAVVWKNDVPTALDPSYSASASAIATDGKNIYIAGTITTNTTTTCLYWHNGVKKELVSIPNTGGQIAFVNAITVVKR